MKKIKLFCIAHAGGSAAAYSKWKGNLNKNIELVPIELAGHGSRIGESLYNTLDEAVNDVYEIIKDELNEGEYAIYGHSMGSWIALELCYKIFDLKKRNPIHLFVSGKEAPFTRGEERIHLLPEKEFEDLMMKLGGTPQCVMESDELKEFFMPIIRADYKIIETHKFMKNREKLNMPITVFNGKDDDILKEEIEAWGNITTGKFNFFNFEGGHFFLYNRVEEVTNQINKIINI